MFRPQKKSIEKAVEINADTIITHHGLFWVFHGPRPITGPFAKRIKPLIEHNINLFGYHLPLDAHREVGNAASLAHLLELQDIQDFGDYKGSPIGVWGSFSKKQSPLELKVKLEKILNRHVLHAQSEEKKEIHNMAIITGGANSGWQDAYKLGLDSYLTGEMSEHDWHESAEAMVHMFAGGHNATENFGIQKLKEHIERKYSVDCHFYESPNPA